MPLLTFQRRWEAMLLSGAKTMTVRANSVRWLRMAGLSGEDARLLVAHAGDEERRFPNRGGRQLHIWLGNPRNRHRSPWVRKLGTSTADWEVGLLRGSGITDGLARRDGLEDAADLRAGLARLNGMKEGRVLTHPWAVVRWEWSRGSPSPAGP